MKLKIHTNNLDYQTIEQFRIISNSKVAEGQVLRGMPDAHFGSGGPIGLTITFKDKISPSLIGSDIGCGVALFNLKLNKKLDLENLKEKINVLPINKNLGLSNSDLKKAEFILKNLKNSKEYNNSLVFESLGTLGGGNHFLEIYKGEKENDYYVSIHTGSRTFGGMVYKKHSKKTTDGSQSIKEKIEKHISDVKKRNNKDELNKLNDSIKKIKNDFTKTEKDYLNWLEGENLKDYLFELKIANQIAVLNRELVMKNFLNILNKEGYKTEFSLVADKPHNYVEQHTENNFNVDMIRKGSQSSYPGEYLLIPINMRDGLIVAKVRDNIDEILRDWNYSAPHGAGRLKSRREAKESIDLEVFKKQMEGVVSATVGESTLDEAPDAYKSLEMILYDMKPILEEEYKILKPIFNHKG